MIQRLVKMEFTEEGIESFKTIFNNSKELIRGFEGCLELKLLQDINDPGIFFTQSQWESETHLNNYRNSELFEKTWKATKALFRAKPAAWSTTILFESN